MLETDQTPGWNYERAALWTAVFLVNLIVPFPLGVLVMAEGGSLGILVATAAVWAAGLAPCGLSPRIASVLIRGSVIVSFSQFVPILQIGSGILALVTWNATLGAKGPHAGPVAGFAVTLLTAMPVVLAAFVFGGGHRLVLGSHQEGEHPDQEPAE